MEKREMIQWRFAFCAGLALMGVVYWGIDRLISSRLAQDFSVFSDNNLVMQSVSKYMGNIRWMLLAAGIVNLLWWLLAYCRIGVRRYFEEYAIFFAAAFIVAAGIITGLILNRVPGIVDELGKVYQYPIWLWIICSFAGNLFFFPPRNVNRVLFFGGRVGHVVCAVLLYGVALVNYVLK